MLYTRVASAQFKAGFPKRVHPPDGASGERGWTGYLYGGSTMNLLCVCKGASEIGPASTWETGDTREGSLARRYQRAQIEAALNAE